MENKEDYILYRLKKSFETLDEVEILFKAEKWNAVVSRLYYASFYAVNALLIKYNISAKSHDGVRNQFSLGFIKTGIVNKKYGKLFTKLFDYRQKGDYGDFFDFDKETVEPIIPEVRDFINMLAKIVNQG
jgi:uncharacterized protein